MRRAKNTVVIATMILALAAQSFSASNAQAEEEEQRRRSEAEALYKMATAAMDAADYATACIALEKVTELIPKGVGARLDLAECYEASGRLVSAARQYEDAEEAAASADQAERRRYARARADALKPRLSYVVIAIPTAAGAIPGLEIAIDGARLNSEQWNRQYPIEKGRHEIKASSASRAVFSRSFTITKEGETLTVVIDELTSSEVRSGAETPAPRAVIESGSVGAQQIQGRATRDEKEPSGRGSSVVLVGGIIATASAACVGAGLAVGSQMAAHDADSAQGFNRARFESLERERVTLANAAFWAFFSAGVVGVSTVIYAAVRLPGGSRVDAPVSVSVAPGGFHARFIARW